MSPKNIGLSGLFIAFVVALPLFVWTAINVNLNLDKRAQGEPNYCGGTCGSNYNCQANFFCFEGYCRNPICSTDTDCVCNIASNTPTTTTFPTRKPTITPDPKGGVETYNPLVNLTPQPKLSSEPILRDEEEVIVPENQFFLKYAIYIIGGFVLIAISTIYYAIKKYKKSIPHILPPTNI